MYQRLHTCLLLVAANAVCPWSSRLALSLRFDRLARWPGNLRASASFTWTTQLTPGTVWDAGRNGSGWMKYKYTMIRYTSAVVWVFAVASMLLFLGECVCVFSRVISCCYSVRKERLLRRHLAEGVLFLLPAPTKPLFLYKLLLILQAGLHL